MKRNVVLVRIAVLALAFLLLWVAIPVLVSSVHTLSSVTVQSGEGPQIQLYGFNPPSSNTIFQEGDQSLSSSQYSGAYYDWSGHNVVGIGTLQNKPATTASITLSTPQSQTAGFLGSGLTLQGSPYSQQISYFATASNGSKYHVTGEVYADTLDIEVKADGSPNLSFHGGTLYFELYVNVWSSQMCDPTNTSSCLNGYVWGAPLEAVITQSTAIGVTPSGTSNSPTNDQIIPMSQGSSFELYAGVGNSVPTGVPLTGSTDGSTVTGGSPLAPDSQMSQYVLFPIAFSNFGPYGCGFTSLSACYPDVTLQVEVYYLVIGSFLWTNPNHTPYTPSPEGPGANGLDSAIGAFGQWISNPLNLGALTTIIIFIVVVVGLIMTAPYWGPLLIEGRLRKH